MTEKKKNLSKEATTVIANARNDITIPFFSTVLQPTDDVLIQKGGGKGLKLYDEIERDSHAHSVLQKRKTTLIEREWEVLPGGDQQRDVDAAVWIEDLLKSIPFDRICEDLLDANLKGYAVSEAVWKRRDGDIVPEKVISQEQRRFVFDHEWKPRLLTMANMSEGLELPERKFIVHRRGVKGNNPYGLGLGSKLFWPVLFKREGVAFWMTFLDKFAGPTVVGKTPVGLASDEQRKLLQTLSNLVKNSAVTVPMGTDVDFLEASRSGSVSYEDWCKYWDGQVSVAVLGETLTTNIGDQGSRAAAETHKDILFKLVSADGDLLSDTLWFSLLRWLVEYNWPGAKVPRVYRLEPENEKEQAEVKQKKAEAAVAENNALKLIVTLSAALTDDQQARSYIQELSPRELDGYLLDSLVASRHAIAATNQNNKPAEPKKKGLSQPLEFADEPTSTVDTLADDLAEASIPFFRNRVTAVRETIQSANSFEDAASQLLALRATWKPKAFADLLQSGFRLAALQGHDAVQREVAGEDDTDAFADPGSFGQPFKEQIDFFEQKERKPSKRWYDLMHGDHDRAFVIAGVTDDAMLSDFQTAIAKAMKEGTGFRQFQKDFDTIVAKYGWNHKGDRDWRSRVIFETNVRTSYMSGRLAQMTDPKVVKMRPYWIYKHAQTRIPRSPRPKHKAWDGLVLAWDDPFWKEHFPPNGWFCSCGVQTLSRRDVERMGKAGPDLAPRVRPVRVKEDDGTVFEVPEGVDPGWNYQPGVRWLQGITPSRVESKVLERSTVPLDQAGTLSDLTASAKPFKSKLLKSGKSDDYYIKKFLSVFEDKKDKGKVYIDKAGEAIPVSSDLLMSKDGMNRMRKLSREIAVLQMAETITDPDEIWLSVAEIQDKPDSEAKQCLVRRYLKVKAATGLVSILSITPSTWSEDQVDSDDQADLVNGQRKGKLLFKRKSK